MNPKNVKFILLAPCLLYLLSFAIFPLVYDAYLSTQDIELTAGTGSTFIGLGNFIALSQDQRFWDTLRNTLVFVVCAVGLELIVGLGLALILNRDMRGQKSFRVLFLLPMMSTPVAVGYMFRMIFNEQWGPMLHFLRLFGLPMVRWLDDPGITIFTMVLIDSWEWTPFMFLALLAGLQGLPMDPYESAWMDGASRWQVFRYVTLPMLSPIIVAASLIRSIDAFKVFDIIYVTTAGGPGTSSETVTMYAQTIGMRYLSIGYAAAISFVLLIAVVLVATIFIRWMRRERR
jgi:multiple sugar transport system permease protein